LQLLARNMSYIKPLTGSVGPRQTKCELKEESVHVDFDDYVSTTTTTRTPDVPSGGSFSVKTRTCIMWAGPATTRVVVSTTVEWTGRSFLKSIIESSALSGQRTYHVDLERAMRGYINSHPTEFVPEGQDVAEISTADATAEGPLSAVSPTAEKPLEFTPNERRKAAEASFLQWVLDTFTSAMKLTTQSFWGLIDILGDLWEIAPDMPDMPDSPTLLSGRTWWIVVLFLLAMNIWTWSSLSQSRAREKLTAKRVGDGVVLPGVNVPDQERLANVATEAVRMFWEGVVDRQNAVWRAQLEDDIKSLKATVQSLTEQLQRLGGAPQSQIPLTSSVSDLD